MENIATVLKTKGDQAEISITQASACGHECDSCGGCKNKERTFRTKAKNQVNAKAGDRVVVELPNQIAFSLLSILFLQPILFMMIGMILFASKEDSYQLAGAVGGLIIGTVSLLYCNKKLKNKTLPKIIRIAETEEN